ncbi:MAG: undecaprenyl-phosphate glucose phosphotransferase [Lentisphaerota bacterium]
MNKTRTYGNVFGGMLQVSDALVASLLFLGMQTLAGFNSQYAGMALIVSGLTWACMRWAGLYHSWRITTLEQESWHIFRGCFFLYVLLLSGIFLLKLQPHFSTRATIYWMVLLPIMLCCGRFVLRLILRLLRSKGFNRRNAIIAGTGELASRLATLIEANPWAGTTLLGVFDDEERAPPAGQVLLGKLDRLPAYVAEHKVDIVYVVLPSHQKEQINWLLHELADSTVSVDFVPDVLTLHLIMGASIIYFGDLPIISLRGTPLRGINALLKRVEDIILAVMLLGLLGPLMLILALAVRLTSRGPALFRQCRYGYNGKAIEVFKFRTMTVAEDGHVFSAAAKHDPRITRLGAFLRRYSLDELPQLINVLQGNMSIVGPRPHAAAMNEDYRKLVHGYMLRHIVRPGMTGLAQVSGCRGRVNTIEDMRKRVAYDLEYVQHWSLGMDVRIILRTFFQGAWITDAP